MSDSIEVRKISWIDLAMAKSQPDIETGGS
jgi:hypothetical protein